MKIECCKLPIACLLLAAAFSTARADAGLFRKSKIRNPNPEARTPKQQRIPLAELPDDGDLPWRLLFLPDDPRNDAKSRWLIDTLSLPVFDDHAGRIRPQTYMPGHAVFDDYARWHAGDLPALVTVSADGDVLSYIRGSSLPIESERLHGELHLSHESAFRSGALPADLKGRLFRPSQPPYYLRPWRWGTGRRPCPDDVIDRPADRPRLPQRIIDIGSRVLPPLLDTVTQGKLSRLLSILEDQTSDKGIENVQPTPTSTADGPSIFKLLLTLLGAGGAGATYQIRNKNDTDGDE